MTKQDSPTILIVDDSGTTRAMIKRVIAATDLEVGALIDAADGKEALALMEETPVDLVLADLNMPVMGGAEMIAAMRRRAGLRDIPVIVISAQPDPDEVARLKRDGVAGYLAKPFTPEAVSGLIAPVLEARKRPAAAPAPAPARSINMSLAEALVEALETMAFISPELPDHPAPPPPADLRVVQIAFHGDGVDGTLTLAAPQKFSAHVTDNCGVAEAVAEPDDVLKELANVICGLVLRKRLGGGVGFKMGPPVMGSAQDVAQWSGGPDVVAVNADGFLLTVHVTADQSLAASAVCG